jgi:hypothetical protein
MAREGYLEEVSGFMPRRMAKLADKGFKDVRCTSISGFV